MLDYMSYLLHINQYFKYQELVFHLASLRNQSIKDSYLLMQNNQYEFANLNTNIINIINSFRKIYFFIL